MKTFFCGPESFTPDLRPAVGEAPELRNYFVAAGMNSIGILSGGGIGRARGSVRVVSAGVILLSLRVCVLACLPACFACMLGLLALLACLLALPACLLAACLRHELCTCRDERSRRSLTD